MDADKVEEIKDFLEELHTLQLIEIKELNNATESNSITDVQRNNIFNLIFDKRKRFNDLRELIQSL